MAVFVKRLFVILALLLVATLANFFYLPGSSAQGLVEYLSTPPTITFRYQDKSWVYDAKDFESANFYYQSIGQKRGRWGDNVARAKLLQKVRAMGFGAKDSLKYCFVGIDNILDNIDETINRAPKDASFDFLPNQATPFRFKKESIGYNVDFDEILSQIADSLQISNKVDIVIEPEVLKPSIFLDDISHYANLRSSFYTSFNGEVTNRRHNIALATGCFNGIVMERGEEFSFNKITGRRSEANGYRPANIIVDKKYVEGYGGGVCQVSTTLYNALLLAGVDILEVHSHSLASSYVNMGFDAMVNYGTSDLRWVNNTDSRLFVQGLVVNNQIHFKIYGYHEENKPTYKRVTEIEKTIDPKADEIIIDKKGEYASLVTFEDEEAYQTLPKKGYRVRAILEKYNGDKLVERKLLRRVNYQSVQGVKVKGSKKRPEVVASPDTQKEEGQAAATQLEKNIINFWRNFI